MSFYKAPAGWTTTSDAKLFTIRLGITQATSIDIQHIILITNILDYAKKAVSPSVYSEQAHSLAVCSTLRLFFSCSLNHRIKLWNCPSNTKWFLYQLVYNNVTNIRVATRFYLETSINSFCSKSVL